MTSPFSVYFIVLQSPVVIVFKYILKKPNQAPIKNPVYLIVITLKNLQQA